MLYHTSYYLTQPFHCMLLQVKSHQYVQLPLLDSYLGAPNRDHLYLLPFLPLKIVYSQVTAYTLEDSHELLYHLVA